MYKPRRDSFHSNNKGSGSFNDRAPRRNFRDRGSFGGGRPHEERPAFEAICAECGSQCLVPFRPTGSKPVLCKRCFEKGNGGDKRPSFGDKRSFRDDRRAEHPQTRTFYADAPKPQSASNSEQLARIESKLDLIMKRLDALENKEDKEEIVIKPKTEEVKEIKPEAKEIKKAKEEKKAKKPKKEKV